MTRSDAYPVSRMEDCTDSLSEATVFSTLDFDSCYWQISFAPAERNMKTFSPYFRPFSYNRMAFGMKSAPATFQRALDLILSKVPWQICLLCLDDVVVLSQTHENYVEHLDRAMLLLRRSDISLKVGCASSQSHGVTI